MTSTELQSMTVLQLRKLARDHQIRLSAGIDKAGIIERLTAELDLNVLQNTAAGLSDSDTETAQEMKQDIPEGSSELSDRLADGQDDESEMKSPVPSSSPRFNSRPAYQAPSSAAHGSWQSTSDLFWRGRQLL